MISAMKVLVSIVIQSLKSSTSTFLKDEKGDFVETFEILFLFISANIKYWHVILITIGITGLALALALVCGCLKKSYMKVYNIYWVSKIHN